MIQNVSAIDMSPLSMRGFRWRCRPAAGIADNIEARLVAIEDFEPLLHIFHADAGAGAAQRGGGPPVHADAVIGYSMKTRLPSRRLRTVTVPPWMRRLQTCFDAVLNERLQQNAGHQDVEWCADRLLFNAQLVGSKRTTSISR